VGGTVFCGGGDTLYAINPGNGAILDSFQAGGEITTPASFRSEGFVYIGSGDGILRKLNKANFALGPLTFVADSSVMDAPLILSGSNDLFFSTKGSVYRINRGTMLPIWQYTPAVAVEVTTGPAYCKGCGAGGQDLVVVGVSASSYYDENYPYLSATIISKLAASLTAGDTEAMLLDVSAFPDSWSVKVDDEVMTYSGRDISTNRLLNLVRGQMGTTAAAHLPGADVTLCLDFGKYFYVKSAAVVGLDAVSGAELWRVKPADEWGEIFQAVPACDEINKKAYVGSYTIFADGRLYAIPTSLAPGEYNSSVAGILHTGAAIISAPAIWDDRVVITTIAGGGEARLYNKSTMVLENSWYVGWGTVPSPVVFDGYSITMNYTPPSWFWLNDATGGGLIDDFEINLKTHSEASVAEGRIFVSQQWPGSLHVIEPQAAHPENVVAIAYMSPIRNVVRWEDPLRGLQPWLNFKVYRIDPADPLGTPNLLATVAGNVYEYEDYAVNVSEQWIYAVQVIDAAGSCSRLAKTGVVNSGSCTATDILVTATASCKGVEVNWNTETSCSYPTGSNFKVMRREPPAVTFTDIATVSSGLSYIDDQVILGKEYCYKIEEIGSFKGVSDEFCLTTFDGLKDATGASTVKGAKLDWVEAFPGGCLPGEKIFVSNVAILRDAVSQGTVAPGTLAFTDGAVPSDGFFTYTLEVSNGVDVIKSITVSVTVTGAPISVTAYAECQGGQVTLSWAAPKTPLVPIVGFNVYRSAVSGGQDLPALNAVPLTHGVFRDTPPPGTFFYKITAIDEQGGETPLFLATEVRTDKASLGVAGWPSYGADRRQARTSPVDVTGKTMVLAQSFAGSFFPGQQPIVDATNLVYVTTLEPYGKARISALEGTSLALRWQKIVNSPGEFIRADSAGHLILESYWYPYAVTTLMFDRSETAIPPIALWTRGDVTIFPLVHDTLLPGTPEDGLVMGTAFPGSGKIEDARAVRGDGTIAWAASRPQPLPRTRTPFMAAVGCDGRIYYGGTESDATGATASAAIIERVDPPSVTGIPGVGNYALQGGPLPGMCPLQNMTGDAVLIDREGEVIAFKFRCAGGTSGVQSFSLPNLTPIGFMPAWSPTLTTGFFTGMAYAKLATLGGMDAAYVSTTNGILMRFDMNNSWWNGGVVLGGAFDVLSAPTASADKLILVANTGTSLVYVVDAVTMAKVGDVVLPGLRCSTAPTIGPDKTWYVIVDNAKLVAIDPPAPAGTPPTMEQLDQTALVAEMPAFLQNIGESVMKGPEGVASVGGAEIAVADTGNSQVRIFDVNGSLVRELGRLGSAEGHFKRPRCVAVAASINGRLYVADTLNNRIQVIDANGVVRLVIGSRGSGRGEFRGPTGVAVDGDGRIIVADAGNNRVQVFSDTGEFLSMFGGPGRDPGEFDGPSGVAVDGDGTIYVTDSGNDRIQLFDSKGTWLDTLAPAGLDGPSGLSLAPDGSLYIADSGNHRVLAVDIATSAIIGTIGRFGAGSGEFDSPHGLAWDIASKVLYVADTGNNRVQVFGYADGATVVTAPAPTKRPESLTLPMNAMPTVPVAVGTASPAGAPPAGVLLSVPPVVDSGVSRSHLALSGVAARPNPVDTRNGELLTITYGVSIPSRVTVLIQDKHSRRAYQFSEQSVASGGSVQWDGRTSWGTPAAPGTYLVTVVATDGQAVVSEAVEIEVANKGGHVPGRPTPKGRGRE
jgi:sugar lactone lactonase YvrE